MAIFERVVEKAANGLANVIVSVIERWASRGSKTEQRPALDPPIKALSIDDAIIRARADMERRRKAGQ